MTAKDKKSDSKNTPPRKTDEELGKRAKDLVEDAGRTGGSKVRGAAQDMSDKAHDKAHEMGHDGRRATADADQKPKDKPKEKSNK